MNSEFKTATPVPAAPEADAVAGPDSVALVGAWRRFAVIAVGVVALAALLLNGLLWQKLANMQEALARQSAQSGVQAMEALAGAKQAQELAREMAARVSVYEARLSEISLQRSQLEELMQSLSRSRDENLVVDIESAIRLAQQQAQLTGSVEPLLAALNSADQRIARASQPRLMPLRRAIGRDINRVKSAVVSDTPGLLAKLDELVRLSDELPLGNAMVATKHAPAPKRVGAGVVANWWQRNWLSLVEQASGLLRVSRIEQPEAALLAPEQSFFLRENLKLRLLNARLGLLARQIDSARAELVTVSGLVGKYFDSAARKTQIAAGLLQQVQTQMKSLQLPRVDETLSALTTAAAGR